MAHVAIYILATDKNLHRLRVMCAGGISGKKHSFTIVLMGEGNKPDFLTSNMKWLAWGNYNVRDKHILILEKGMLEDADYHVFTDDDSFVDVDNMVESLDKQNDKNYPCYWSQPEMGNYINNIDMISMHFSKIIKNESELNRFKSSWIGWCWTVINRKFADVAQKSKQARLTLEFSYTINSFVPDWQICIVGSLIKAKHFYKNPSPGGTQWKDYFNHSLIVKGAPLWLIHYTIDNKILDFKDLLNTVKKGPQSIDDAIYSLFSSKFKKGVKPKHVSNKKFQKNYFFVYWGHHAWHHPVIDEHFKNNIIMYRDGRIKIENTSMEYSWEENKKGIIIYDDKNIPISELRWTVGEGLIGKNLIHKGRVLDLFKLY